MPISAAIARCIFRALPLPGRVLRPILQALNPRCPSSPVITSLPGGLRMEIRNFNEYIQRNIYFFGRYEVRETRLVKRLLSKGDTFVDVGANIGWFTLLAAHRVGPAGRIFAFEPSSAIRAHLLDNLRANALENVKVDGRALSDSAGIATLSLASPNNAGIGSIVGGDVGELVETTPFDAVFPTLGVERIRLTKVDVEGAEFKVLRGMDQTLRERRIANLLIEVNDSKLQSFGESAGALIEWMSERGYRAASVAFTGPVPLDSQLVGEANLLFSCT